jgi:hypothetical protein
MTFRADMSRFTDKARGRERALFTNVVSATEDSIKRGSAVTGAPGQPVDTGNLLGSWTTQFEGRRVALVSTNVSYAPEIEDNERGAQLRSEVGGFHSTKLTRAGFERIVEDELRKLGDGPAPGARARDSRGRFV